VSEQQRARLSPRQSQRPGEELRGAGLAVAGAITGVFAVVAQKTIALASGPGPRQQAQTLGGVEALHTQWLAATEFGEDPDVLTEAGRFAPARRSDSPTIGRVRQGRLSHGDGQWERIHPRSAGSHPIRSRTSPLPPEAPPVFQDAWINGQRQAKCSSGSPRSKLMRTLALRP